MKIETVKLEDPEYIMCDCGCELVVCSHEPPWEGYEEGEAMDFINIAFFERGKNSNRRVCWRERLRHIWHIIKTGTPWADEIILRTPERLKLMAWLDKVEKRRLKFKAKCRKPPKKV